MKRLLMIPLATTFMLAALAYAGGAKLTQLQQDDKRWVMQNKEYAATRYSSLNEIKTHNNNNTKISRTFSPS